MIDQAFASFARRTFTSLDSMAFEKAVIELTARASKKNPDLEKKLIDRGLAAPIPPVDQEAIGQAQYRIHVIASELAPFAELPDPAGFTDVARALDEAASLIAVTASHDRSDADGQEVKPDYARPKLATLGSVSAALNEWTGPAASSFRKEFVDGLGVTISNNYVAIKSMSLIYKHLAQLWTTTNANAREHLQKAQNSMNNCLHGDDINWSVMLTATASIATLAATIPTLGGGAALGVAAVDAGASFVPSILPAKDEPPSELTLGPQYRGNDAVVDPFATTAESILEETLRGLKMIVERVVAEEAQLALQLNRIQSDIIENRELFRPPVPHLSANPGQKLTSPDLMGIPKIA